MSVNDQESIQVGADKYDQYQAFGITYSAADEGMYLNGQRVKFLVDWRNGGGSPDALWTDGSGTVNLAVIRDASGLITKIESISDEKAREYQSAIDEYNQNALKDLEKRVEERINQRFH